MSERRKDRLVASRRSRASEPVAATTASAVIELESGPLHYRLIRSARRRRTIEIAIEGAEVVVRAPLHAAQREIVDVLRRRTDWIARHIDAVIATPERSRFVDGTTIPYLGRALELSVTADPGADARAEHDLLGLHVALPAHLGGAAREPAIREAITACLRTRAEALLPERAWGWASRLGWTPRRVLVRDQRRRWGSCAPDGSVRLNWRLMMLDEALVDYVIVHELAHLHEPNHGPRFWATVGDVIPDVRARRRRLREDGRRLPL